MNKDSYSINEFISKYHNSQKQFAHDYGFIQPKVCLWSQRDVTINKNGESITVKFKSGLTKEFKRLHYTTLPQAEYDENIKKGRKKNGSKGGIKSKKTKYVKKPVVSHRSIIIKSLEDEKSTLRYENQWQPIKNKSTETGSRA